MIGLLIGTIAYRYDPYLIVNVHGVGYKVYVTSSSLSTLQSTQSEITLFIYTHVRDDALELYGFLDPADLKLFENLINVSGVGCKTAMGIFNAGKRSDIIDAIIRGDTAFFISVPRLGKKNAQKIIIELKPRFGSSGDLDLTESESGNEIVIAALKQFGYSSYEIRTALQSIAQENVSDKDKIRLALQFLGKR